MRVVYWLGWMLVLFAWCDLGLDWLLGLDIWIELLGVGASAPPWSYGPVIIGCLGVVLISLGK